MSDIEFWIGIIYFGTPVVLGYLWIKNRVL
jgi:hypothetical protein